MASSKDDDILFDALTSPGSPSSPANGITDERSNCTNTTQAHRLARSRDKCNSRSSNQDNLANGDNNDLFPLPSPTSRFTSSSQDGFVEPSLPYGKRDRKWVISRIEAVFAQQLTAIMTNNGHLEVKVNLRPNTGDSQSVNKRYFRFPGKSEKDGWRYTVIIRILELVYDALLTDKTITKREIYYRDPALFSKQAVVDRFVDDLAYTFGVSRLLLNVNAAAKGLIAGNFTIHKGNGLVTEGKSEREGVLISPLREDAHIDIDLVQWVLVVEKEATFRALVSSPFWERLSSHGLLVTGKGYPDIATRLLLRSICLPTKLNSFKLPPVYGLVDYDPDGIDILSTYKHGSSALAYEKSALELPRLQWLGIKSADIGYLEDVHQTQGLLRLTERDRHKAVRMLSREIFTKKESEWRREVQVMLFLNRKAEIQLLDSRLGGLVEWLSTRGV